MLKKELLKEKVEELEKEIKELQKGKIEDEGVLMEQLRQKTQLIQELKGVVSCKTAQVEYWRKVFCDMVEGADLKIHKANSREEALIKECVRVRSDV